MQVTYDPSVDALKIVLKQTAIAESDELSSGVILDYDGAGNVVGIEILNASQRMDNPQSCDYSVLAPLIQTPPVATSQWSKVILAYEENPDFPAFESYRDDLLPPNPSALF